jgi:hypothetical protein
MPKLIHTKKILKRNLSQKEYNKLYYQENKKRIQEKKKNKWEMDETYRKGIIDRLKKYREKNKKSKSPRGSNMPRIIHLSDNSVSLLYPPFQLQKILYVSYKTILNWIECGKLPTLIDLKQGIWIPDVVIKRLRKINFKDLSLKEKKEAIKKTKKVILQEKIFCIGVV